MDIGGADCLPSGSWYSVSPPQDTQGGAAGQAIKGWCEVLSSEMEIRVLHLLGRYSLLQCVPPA